MDIFSIRLKKALEMRNMKPIELANKLNINKGIVSNYLNNKYKPKADRLHQIAIILDVNVAWLMGYDVVMDKSLEPEELYIEMVKLITIANIPNDLKNKLNEELGKLLLR